MDDRNDKISGDIKINIPMSKKFENFWYYYKWHTIIGACVLIVFSILTFQFCTKEEYDVHIIYAGEKRISTSTLNGEGNSEFSDIVEALESLSKNDENVNISMQTLYILSPEELEEVLEGMQDELQKNELRAAIDDNRKQLKNYVINGNYHLCLLSEDVFLSLDTGDGENSIFMPLADYTTDGYYYNYVNERGIYLHSLDIYMDSALSSLPKDTIICLRIPREFGSNETEAYAKAEVLLRSLLASGN